MTVKNWLFILFIEILIVILVIFIFSQLDHQIAGLIAGFLFGLLGLIIGFQLLRARSLRSFTFWWLFVYMFYSVIPMILKRLGAWGTEFSDITIWGMAGPEFHKVSERIYLVLIFSTIFDLTLTWFSKRKARK